MIALKQGEVIKKAFDARCKFGAGMLYVTNQRIVFEITKQGVLLDLPYEEVKSYQATNKDTLLLNWEEIGKGRFNLEFKIKHANEVEYEIKNANDEYASLIINTPHLAGMEQNARPPATTSEQLLAYYRPVMERAERIADEWKRSGMSIIYEVEKVRELLTKYGALPDGKRKRWNNCYYYPERRVYIVTDDSKKEEYTEDMVIMTRFGYPAVVGDNGIVLILLPTVPKAGLTEELVKARALKEIDYETDDPRGSGYSFGKFWTEYEYQLLWGEDYVPKEEREAYEKYKTMKNPKFVEDNKKATIEIWSKRYKDEDPKFIEKCAEEINKMWLTIDEEQYLAQEDYNDRRIEVKEIDGRLVALGCDFGETVIYRNIDDMRYWISDLKSYFERKVRIFDDEHKDEESRLKLEYNKTMIKCCENILTYDFNEAKKYRDQGFDINCRIGRKVIHYLVPLMVDTALEYINELSKREAIQRESSK